MLIRVFMLVVLWVIPAAAQLNQDQIKQLEAGLDGRGQASAQRLTSQGVFAGCELTFQNSFRDGRANSDYRLVNVVGSIATRSAPDKPFFLIVKAKPSLVSISPNAEVKMKPFEPAFAALVLGTASLEKHRHSRWTCEGGGECVGYADNNNLDLLKRVTEEWSNGPTILLTTAKNGVDQPIQVNELENGIQATTDFYQCIREQIKVMREWANRNLR